MGYITTQRDALVRTIAAVAAGLGDVGFEADADQARHAFEDALL